MLKKSQNNCKIISSWQTQDIIISDLSLIIGADLSITQWLLVQPSVFMQPLALNCGGMCMAV